jgi:hypothetical protein
MNAYCPDCETELDQATGICPACRWDPVIAQTVAAPRFQEAQLSLTERYRGTAYDISLEQATMQHTGVSRGRAFVLLALLAGVALYGVIIGAMGVF